MVYGEISGNDFTYEVGVFDDDGDNGELKEPQFVQAGEDLKGVGPSLRRPHYRELTEAAASGR